MFCLGALLFFSVLNFKTGSLNNENDSLTLDLFQSNAMAACEFAPIGPLPGMNCTRAWCSSTYSYSACGSGNSQINCGTFISC